MTVSCCRAKVLQRGAMFRRVVRVRRTATLLNCLFASVAAFRASSHDAVTDQIWETCAQCGAAWPWHQAGGPSAVRP